MLCGIDPKVDFAFKRIFGDPRNLPLSMSLINSIFKDSDVRPITGLEIVNPFNLKDTPTDKLSILDIKAKDETGRQINLEMQLMIHKNLRPRIVFYLTEMHAQQLREGEDYGKLSPSISILIVNDILFPNSPQVHSRFRLCDSTSGMIFSDQIEMHVIELPKLLKSDRELATDLEQWVYFFLNAKGLDMNALPEGLTVPEIKKALSELTRMKGTEEERIRYLEREHALREMLTWQNELAELETAKETARRVGLEEGIQQTQMAFLSKGRLIDQIHELEQARQLPVTATPQLLEMSEEQLRKFLDDLKSLEEGTP